MTTSEPQTPILNTLGGGFGISLSGSQTDTAETAAPSDASDTPVRDIVIVGSGPAGYTAAVYAARAGLKPVVIAGSLDAGGALMTTTEVENFPGFPEGVMGPDLMGNMQEQAERFGAEILFEDATEVELAGDVKTIRTEGGEVFRAKAVILATGSAYRKLGVDGEERLSGKGVSW